MDENPYKAPQSESKPKSDPGSRGALVVFVVASILTVGLTVGAIAMSAIRLADKIERFAQKLVQK